MRKASRVLGVLFLLTVIVGLSPTTSFADTSIKGKTDCPAGSSTADPTGKRSFGTEAGAASAIQAYMYSAESCASACYDENINVDVSILTAQVTINVKATNQCKTTPVAQPSKAQPPRGCAASQTQPQITLEVPEVTLDKTYMKKQTIGPKSRCYGAVTTTVAGLTQGGISGMSNPAAVQSNLDNLNALSTEAPQGAVAPGQNTIQGNEQLVAALTSTGISTTDAKKIASDPVSAQALINAYATGNKDTIQDTVQDAAAKAHISLNDGVYSNISSLSSDQVQASKDVLSPLANDSGTTIASASGFSGTGTTDQPLKGGVNAQMIAAAEQQYNLPRGLLGNMCNSESRCTSVCSSSSSACGMYQYTTGTWTGVTTQMCAQGVSAVTQYCSGGTISTSLRSDPYVATQVAGWNISQNLQQYEPLINQTGIDKGTAAYIMQGLGTGGAQKFFQAYVQNPNMSTADFLYQTQPGSAARILAINGNLYAGQTLQGTVNQFAANLGAPGATTAPVGSAIASAGSPFAFTTDVSGGSTMGTYVTSPFANVSPIYSTPGLGSAASYPISYGQPQQQYQQPYQPSNQYPQNPQYPVQPVQPQPGTVTNPTQPSLGHTGAAVAQIIAQPKNVSRGGSITVSWTSVGTSVSSPCRVTQSGTTLISNAPEGFKVIAATATGTIQFAIQCTSQNTGSTITGSASVTVQ